MRHHETRSSWLAIAAIGVLSVAVLSPLDSAHAQRGRSPDAERACTPDVMRLCQEYIPDVGPIVGCLKRKRLLLSRECRPYIFGGKKRGRA